MKHIVVIIVSLICACREQSDVKENEYPSSYELKYKTGDCLYFMASDSTYGCVVVADYLKDEAGIWYGTFYTGYEARAIPTLTDVKKGKVMGRKVASAIDELGYRSCLDGDFIHDSIFTDTNYFTLIGNIRFKGNTNPGGYGAITSMENLRVSFQKAKEFRKRPPDHYSNYLSSSGNFHPEEYFRMSDFIK